MAGASPEGYVELDLEGMTCAACATRIETRLNKLEGVEASVNLATDKATVRYAAGKLGVEQLIEAVRDTGYEARVATEGELRDHSAEHRKAFREFLVAAVLTAPFLIEMGGMALGRHGVLPGWLQFALATPVQFWCGMRFYTGAWKSLRGGGANMDVLVALGTSAAYGFSVAVLALGLPEHLYFEASAAVVTLVLLGKFLEARPHGWRRRDGWWKCRLPRSSPAMLSLFVPATPLHSTAGWWRAIRPSTKPCSPARACPSTRRPAAACLPEPSTACAC